MDPPLLLNERNIFILAHNEAYLKWQGPYYYVIAARRHTEHNEGSHVMSSCAITLSPISVVDNNLPSEVIISFVLNPLFKIFVTAI